MLNYFDVLKAQSGIPVDDIWAEIWGTAISDKYTMIEYTGSLPITISANGDALLDYRIYGADGGVGEPTENLIDADKPGTQRVELEPNTDYCLCKYTGSGQGGIPSCYVYDENNNQLFGDYINAWVSYSFTNPSNGAYAIISFDNSAKGKLSFTKGRAANNSTLYPADYVPYGYILPMTAIDNLAPPLSQWVNGYVRSTDGAIVPITGGNEEKASDFIEVKSNTQYVFSIEGGAFPQGTGGVWVGIGMYRDDRTFITRYTHFKTSPCTFLTLEGTKYVRLSYRTYGELLEPRLSEFSFSTPVYIGENQLDSVEGVSDYIDKSRGKIVRMIGEYTFTGDESFNKYGSSDVFYTSKTIDPVGITTVNTTTMRCDHPAFTAIENKDTRYWLNPEADDICCFLPGGRSQVFLRSTSNFTTAAECEAYLKAQFDNGTPVKISYWLKTPVEEEPPVPFPEIPTIDGTTVIDYDGDPKPSQMYVKYKGKG